MTNTPISEIRSDRELYGSLVRLAAPIMVANLLQMLYNLADAFFLGKISAEAVAAPSISLNLVMFLVVSGLALAMAGTTLISQSKGKGDRDRIDFYLGQTAILLLTLSVVVSLIGVVFARQILGVLQVPRSAFAGTLAYLRIILSGVPVMFFFFVVQAAMQGIGDSVTPLKIQALTVALNVALDPILIFGFGPIPRLEVEGAAIATVFSRAIASGLALWILLRGSRGMKLRAEYLVPDWAAQRRLLGIGVPLAIGQGVASLGFIVLQGIVNSFGTAVVAAFGVGTRIINLFTMPAIGFSRATASLVGQSLGARRPDTAKTVVKQSIGTVFVFISVTMILVFLFGNSVTRFFVNDPEVVRHGAIMFRVISLSVIPFAMFMVSNGAFQGGGDTKPIMYLNVGRLWGIRVPVAALLAVGLSLGPRGIWFAMLLSNVVTAALGFIILKQGRWLHKMNPEEI
ncbi:MAG: MATE family efflux transporter [Spirochaetaceae bacterium]